MFLFKRFGFWLFLAFVLIALACVDRRQELIRSATLTRARYHQNKVKEPSLAPIQRKKKKIPPKQELQESFTNASIPNIRVARLDSTLLNISGPSIGISIDNRLVNASRFALESKKNGIVLNGKNLVQKTLSFDSKGEFVINGKKIHGPFEVVWRLERKNPILTIVSIHNLEVYVAGVVAKEVPRSWPDETLNAQCVAARTYAAKRMAQRKSQPFHVVSTIMDQVFDGKVAKNHPAYLAAQRTKGKVLMYDGELIDAYFHSSCGGHTESSRDGWGSARAYLPAKECPYCTGASLFSWSKNFSHAQVQKAVQSVLHSPLRSIRIESRTDSGRAKKVLLIGRTQKSIPAAKLRELIGYMQLPSTFITDIHSSSTGFVFKGHGFGHGVGMCQHGAQKMAKDGQNYDEILAFYYPGSALVLMY